VRFLEQSWSKFWTYVIGHDFVTSVLASAATAIAGIGIAWENKKIIPSNPDPLSHYLAEPHNHLSFLAKWDGADYIHIAVHGYDGALNTNFFPLYPLLIRLIHPVVGSPLDSALLLSWAAFIGATYFYLKIVKQLYRLKDTAEALRGVLFFLFFPTAIFLFVAYTESLFACLTLGTVYFALNKRYLPAAGLALLASAVHDNGVFVVVLLVLMMWEQRASLVKIGTAAVIGCLGIVGYMIYLAARFHNALAFVTAQKSNGWLHYGLAGLSNTFSPMKVLFLVPVAVSVWYWWPRRKSFAVYSLLFVGIFFLGGSGAYGRYALLAFPVQLMFYDYLRKRKLGYALVLIAMTMLWMFFLLQYTRGYNTGG
jgi:Gpi18-like mannosyltransferase